MVEKPVPLFTRINEAIAEHYKQLGVKKVPLVEVIETLESAKRVYTMVLFGDYAKGMLKEEAEKQLKQVLR